jgi:TonB family protein
MRLSNRTAVFACALMAAALAPGALAAQADSTACATTDRLADGRTVAVAADSLFRLAHEREREGDYVLVPFTRKARELSRGSSPTLTALSGATMSRMMQGGLTALVAYQIDREGKPVRVEIVRSSHDPQFDRIAGEVLQGARYRPARAGACDIPFFEVTRFTMRMRADPMR